MLSLYNSFCLHQLQYEKTFANSHGAIVFRRALQDGPTRELFVRYLQAGTHSSTKFPQQDVHFWLEVQRYKVREAMTVVPLSDS